MNISRVVAAIFTAAVLSLTPAPAQETPKLAETKVVLRVSRELLQKLAGTRFEKDQPINSNADGVAVSGNAHVTGEVDVKIRESATESDFDLHIRGDIATRISATRRPVIVMFHGDAPFSASRHVTFDGATFAAQPVWVSVANRFCLDCIAPFRPGVGGAITRKVAKPFAVRGLRDGDLQADDQIRTEVGNGIQDATDKMLQALNSMQPTIAKVRDKLAALAREKKHVLVPYHAATKHHLLISFCLPGRTIPHLPNLDPNERAPLELWVAKRHDILGEIILEAGLQELKMEWQKNSKKLGEMILRKHPELVEVFGAEIEVDAHVRQTKDWHIITMNPTIKGRPLIVLP
jgi:hypothetical protein